MNRLQGKKVLIITHQLSGTGAPFVLLSLLEIGVTFGMEFEVISMQDGILRTEYEKIATVSIQKEFLNEAQKEFVHKAEEFDCVFVNTLLPFEVIHLLNGKMIPVIWWLHEPENYFEFLKDVLPDFSQLESNINVYAVSPYVETILFQRYQKHVPIFLFGIEDYPKKTQRIKQKKMKFLVAGTISYLKGQDIFIDSIQNLQEEVFENCEFIFCGNMQMKDEKIYKKIKQMSALYNNIMITQSKSKQDFLDYLEEVDCLVVPSRVDTVSSVAVEMLMKEGLCICSDGCGISTYIKDERDAFVFERNNSMQLADKMERVYNLYHSNEKEINLIRNNARKVYEKYFSKEIFHQKVDTIFQEAFHQNEAYYKVLECIRQEAWEQAVEGAIEMVKQPFSDKQAILLASINLHFHENTQALDMIYKGLLYNPNNYELYFMLGNYYKRSNRQKACEYYKKALMYCTDSKDKALMQKISDDTR